LFLKVERADFAVNNADHGINGIKHILLTIASTHRSIHHSQPSHFELHILRELEGGAQHGKV
jgi:hypothetical protein